MHGDSQAPDRTVPDRDDILKDVIQILAEEAGMSADSIQESDMLIEDLGLDSLGIVEVSMEIEEHFDITIPDGFEERARTVGDVTDGVMQLLTGSGPR